jgi:hypothetical protein
MRSEALPKERRTQPRLVVNRTTTWRAERGKPRHCLITNISADGARLFTEDAVVPEQFDLVIAENLERRCQVVWRLGGEIGVRFLDGSLPLGRS